MNNLLSYSDVQLSLAVPLVDIVGEKFMCVGVFDSYVYENQVKTDKTDGKVLQIVLIDKKFEKINVKVPFVSFPVNEDEQFLVEFEGLAANVWPKVNVSKKGQGFINYQLSLVADGVSKVG